MSSLDVEAVLSSSSSLPSCEVSRVLETDLVDEGNLVLVESNRAENLDEQKLQSLARENAQELLNHLFAIPTLKVDDVTVVPLPPPKFRLPREKPLPKPRPPTKWEQYAKEKGIQKKKKTNLQWDDVVKDWVPRFGYKKAKAEEQKNWMMEIKDNADPHEDPFEKAREQKRERVAKNELQRLRNIARSKKVKVPGVGLTPVNPTSQKIQESTELKKAAELAKKSTASLGKFQDKLKAPLEKQAKPTRSKKRQFDPLIMANEKERNLKILDSVQSKKPKLDVSKAVGKTIHEEEKEMAVEKKKAGKKGKRKGGGGRGGGKRGAGRKKGGAGGGMMKGGKPGGKKGRKR